MRKPTKQELRDQINSRDYAMEKDGKWWSDKSQAYLPFDHEDFKGLLRLRPPNNNVQIKLV